MFEYAICNISGKQVKVVPGKEFEIDVQEDTDSIIARVLLRVEKDKVEIGKPYLKEDLKFEVLGNFQKKKVRVFKYHAKANYRRTNGIRPKITKVVYTV